MMDEISYGRRLRNAREAAGLSVAEVAGQLHLQAHIVESLEREQLKQELAPAFIRGYIRAYSQLVYENADDLVELYNRHADKDPELIQLENIESPRGDSSRLARWGAISVSVVLLILAAIWLHDYLQSRNRHITGINNGDVMVEPSRQAVPDGIPVEPEIDSAVENDSSGSRQEDDIEQIIQLVNSELGESNAESATSDTLVEDQAQLANVSEAVPNEAEQSELEENEVVPLAPEGHDQLVLTFTGTSWIEATDANGFRLIYGLFDQGDNRLSVRGSAPFRVVVGDANKVEVRVNGQKFELGRHTRADNTARVLLGEKGLNR